MEQIIADLQMFCEDEVVCRIQCLAEIYLFMRLLLDYDIYFYLIGEESPKWL